MLTAAERCLDHPERPAAGACVSCGRPICAACRCRREGATRCARCHRAQREEVQPAGGESARLFVTVMTAAGAAVLSVLLSGTAVVQLRAEAAERRNQESMKSLSFSLDDFFLDAGRYPTPEEGLAALVSGDPDGDGERIPDWQGPYLRLKGGGVYYDRFQEGFLDAWGSPILYWTAPEQSWVYVASAGGNGRFDSPAVGSREFSGHPKGDDLLIWLEGP